MILDSLRNWAFYCGADSRLKRALEYLAAADLNTLEPGRYEIEGAEIFMKVTEGELKREEEASLEVHDKYIDVQVLIAGEVETCLLYTSPSPRVYAASRMPSSA